MPHPDSTATQIDSYQVAITLTTETSLPQVTKTCQAINQIVVFRTSTDQIDYVIEAPSIEFDQNGDGEAVDATSASGMFEPASIAAVQEGVVRGHTGSPACVLPAQAIVYVDGCVSRTSSGVSTVISACTGTAMGHRVLSVCTPNGTSTPQVTVSSRSQPGCSGAGCEATCNQP